MTIGNVLDIVLSLIAVLTAIILHEVSHGYVAYRLGDPTAKMRGRLTLNPLAHVDPIGTILVPLVLVVIRSPFLFGWAKPVPINPNYFRNPFRGMLYVAIAGPTTNLGLALVTTAVGRLLLVAFPDPFFFARGTFAANLIGAVLTLLGVFVVFNIILAVFNMIPIPPLDGSRVLAYFLPPAGRRIMIMLERYGFLILIAFIFLGGLNALFGLMGGIWDALLGDYWQFAAGI